MIRLAVILTVASQLSGCFFVFIPPGAFQAASDLVTGARGDYCVKAEYKAGDEITLTDGRKGTVRATHGTSRRCRQADFPIRAELDIL